MTVQSLFFYIFLLLLGGIILFKYLSKTEKEEKEEYKKSKKGKKSNSETSSDINNTVEHNIVKDKEKPKTIEDGKLVNSFREMKIINGSFFSNTCSYVVFHDEKKFCLAFLNTDDITSEIKKYVKNIDYDFISSVNYNDETKLMAVALKNTKEILIYHLANENGKLKFVKENKTIKTERSYGIKDVVINKNGNFVATTGCSQDTEVQIYDISNNKLHSRISINEFENIEMKLSPLDDCLIISTLMYNLAVIELSSEKHHVKNSSIDEIVYKAERKRSIGEVKSAIKTYDISNINNYFYLMTVDGIKIFKIYGHFYESKVEENILFDKGNELPEQGSVYILNENISNHKINGFICYNTKYNLHIKGISNNFKKTISNVSDSAILRLKLFSSKNKLYVIVSCLDGRFNIIDTEIAFS